jgi:TRAP-type C4-dicarboxylate transport system permease small subunit
LSKGIDLFFKLLELLVVACMLAMVVMVFGNVVLRYGFNSGITVSDEMSRYCFIWLTYIGAMIAMREKGHLGVDTLVKHLPINGKKICLFMSEDADAVLQWPVPAGNLEDRTNCR